MNSQEQIAFIINPIAGRRHKINLQKVIESKLDQEVWLPVFCYTERQGHAGELVDECVEKGIKFVVAVGGDGTVNEVATAALRYGASLGIIPMGSGNGLARFLKIPLKVNHAVRCINQKNVRAIDVGSIQEKYFFCTCGVGFDAKIGRKFAEQKKRGFASYIKTTVAEFNKYKSKTYKIKVDGEKVKRTAFLITIANAGQYGNNAYIAPRAQIDDGKLELCIFKPFPWYMSLLLGIRLFSKTIDKSKYIEIYQANTIEFSKEKSWKFHVDGEPVKIHGKPKIKILPKSLMILTPNKDSKRRSSAFQELNKLPGN